MLNIVAIMGRLVADPELRTTANGSKSGRRILSTSWSGGRRLILSASISRKAA